MSRRSFSYLSMIGLIALCGCSGPESVSAPAAFSPFTSPDKTFAGVGPDGWKKEEAGVQGGMQGSVSFDKGSAEVSMTSDMQGSLMADMSRANNAQVDNVSGMLPPGMQANMPQPIPPVEKLHKMTSKSLAKKYGEYEEQAMKPFTCSLGEARVSEWTGESEGMVKYKVHGYRATVLSMERRLTAVCRCSETDWSKLKPGFEKVLSSLANGGG